MMGDNASLSYKAWYEALQARREAQTKWNQYITDNVPYDEDAIRRLDSTLKKVTAFMKRVKNIGTTVTLESLLPELTKLNLSKFIDEIASSVCDVKVRTEELPSLVDFCVRAASIYASFPDYLIAEIKKRVPTKRSDKITNASKLRVDLKFISELILAGVIGTEGVQLLGTVLAFVVNTDKSDFVNVPILLPLCQSTLFECTGLVPLSYRRSASALDITRATELLPSTPSEEQRAAIAKLLHVYFDALIEHLNDVRLKMNSILKSIKRQERTRGDAAPEDRLAYEELKTRFDRLLASANELGQWLSKEVPEMAEELSDDESDEPEVEKAEVKPTQRVTLFLDEETRLFYERLGKFKKNIKQTKSKQVRPLLSASVEQAALAARNSPTVDDEPENETNEYGDAELELSVEDVNVDDLELSDESDTDTLRDESLSIARLTLDEESADNASVVAAKAEAHRESSVLNPLDNIMGISLNMTMFLNKLCNAINKERIDAAALEFITNFNKAAHRKRLIQHLLSAPFDRLDLLPFYCRFMATIRPVVVAVPNQVARTLLERFRDVADRKCSAAKTVAAKAEVTRHVDAKVHLSKYMSEMVKFGLLPKAEGLACLRRLLVDLRQFKVDMFSAMIESMGAYLYNLPETHAKMKVIISVLRTKTDKIKDQRQKLLLENAYFVVLPAEEDTAPLQRRPPMEEYILTKIMKLKSAKSATSALRRINWADTHICDYTLGLLSNPCNVPYDQIERLAKLVGSLTDFHDWIGVFVVDDVLEFIRVALERNDPALYQQLFSSVVYIGQLFNYTVCNTAVIFKVFYQLISYNINAGRSTQLDCTLRMRRMRLAIALVRTIGEYFGEGRPKKRMDCFLYYLFLFYFDTKECWAPFVEEVGEFPQEISDDMNSLLTVYRRKERNKYPKTLESAREAVHKMQLKYHDKAAELAEQAGHLMQPEAPEQEGPRKANNADDEEDDEAAKDGDVAKVNGVEAQTSAAGEQPTPPSTPGRVRRLSTDGEQEVQLAKSDTPAVPEPEDDDLMRDLDRAIMEAYQSAPVISKASMLDLEVPPSARQKFERKITFAEETKQRNRHMDEDAAREPPERPRVQMALMTRKSNRTVLKAVNLEPSQGMHEALLELRAQDHRERQELKVLTLALDERIATREQDEAAQQH